MNQWGSDINEKRPLMRGRQPLPDLTAKHFKVVHLSVVHPDMLHNPINFFMPRDLYDQHPLDL